MNPMVPGLTGTKMSSSDANSKLDLLDSAKDVKNKINKAFCEEGNIENNGPLSFSEYVLFPIFKEMTVERKDEYGGNKTYKEIESMRTDFAEKSLHPGDLKKMVIKYVNQLLEPIREEFKSPALQKLTHEAYPESAPKKVAPKKKGPPQAQPITPGRLDLRVGEITAIDNVEGSDKLYIETVNFGEKIGTRTILSGLNNLVPKEELLGSKRVFLTNLKPQKMAGIESQGMLMCASHTEEGGTRTVTPLVVPENAKAGDRITVEGHEKDTPDERLNPKKKIWETLAPGFKVNDDLNAEYNGMLLKLEGLGIVTSKQAGAIS